jgi:hypothetical protein
MLPADGSKFELWVKGEPPLTHVGLGGEFPPNFDLVLIAAGVSAPEFRQILASTTEVLYSSMYAAADEKGSSRYLSELAKVAESVGVEWPDLNCFFSSKWSDCHGWGNRLSQEEIARWKSVGRG